MRFDAAAAATAVVVACCGRDRTLPFHVPAGSATTCIIGTRSHAAFVPFDALLPTCGCRLYDVACCRLLPNSGWTCRDTGADVNTVPTALCVCHRTAFAAARPLPQPTAVIPRCVCPRACSQHHRPFLTPYAAATCWRICLGSLLRVSSLPSYRRFVRPLTVPHLYVSLIVYALPARSDRRATYSYDLRTVRSRTIYAHILDSACTLPVWWLINRRDHHFSPAFYRAVLRFPVAWLIHIQHRPAERCNANVAPPAACR